MNTFTVMQIGISGVTLFILIFGVAVPFGKVLQWKESFKESVDERFDGVHGRIKGVEDDVKEIRGKI